MLRLRRTRQAEDWKKQREMRVLNSSTNRDHVACTTGYSPQTLGKGFAECSTQQTTLGKFFNGKRCLLSVFCRILGSERVTSVPSNIIDDVVLWK
jgi:hypothetical protein